MQEYTPPPEENQLTVYKGGIAGLKNGLDLILIIDKSLSMAGTEQRIVENYQKMICHLRGQGRDISVATILFAANNDMQLVCPHTTVTRAPALKYAIAPSTAAYDAVGTAIEYENEYKKRPENPHPNADVLYMLITDCDCDNSSRTSPEECHALIHKERMRSAEGHGVREFALIHEIGLDFLMYHDPSFFDQNHKQLFTKRDRGITALFQTVSIAAQNMLTDGQITDTFKTQSNKLLADGRKTLGDLNRAQRIQFPKQYSFNLSSEGTIRQIEGLYHTARAAAESGDPAQYNAAIAQMDQIAAQEFQYHARIDIYKKMLEDKRDRHAAQLPDATTY